MGFLDRIFKQSTAQLPAAQPPAPPTTRRAESNIRATRNFEAALSDRLNASWNSPSLTSNEEIASALEITRNRARSLAKDNEFAHKYLAMVVANVVGPGGFMLQSLAREADSPDTLARKLIEKAFIAWQRRGVCEVSGRMSFADVQRQVIETWARDGEALIVQVTGKAAGNPHGYALRLLEVERLSIQYTKDLKDGHQAVMGVELNPMNRPVAYWLNLGKLGSTYGGQGTLTRLDAAQVLHVFKPYRPEQVRGMPSMHTVISGLKMLDGYEEAAIVAARVGAAKMGFFTTPDGDASPLGNDEDDQGNYITDAEPGSFQALPKGVDLQNWNPEYPHANYQAFMKTRLRSIASGLGVTYHGLANDLEGVNFSSIRSGTLEERDAWMVLQNWFIEAFLTPVFLEWLTWSLTNGAIQYPGGAKLPIAKYEKFSEHTWLGRRWGWVDPLKDIEAARLSIKSGIASPQMIAAQSGVDIEDVIAAIADFEAIVAKSGISLINFESNPQGQAAAAEATQVAADTATATKAMNDKLHELRAMVSMMATREQPAAPGPVIHNNMAPPVVHNHLPAPLVEVKAADPAPVTVVNHNQVHVPETTVNVEAVMPEQRAAAPAINVVVQPADVTVNNAFARTAVQTVQRDKNDEIISTTTEYTP